MESFPHEAAPREQIAFLLRYATLAPSIHNTQPWMFFVEDANVEIRADRRHWLRIADPDQRSLHMSVGCALENLLVAAEHFGLGHRVEIPAGAGPGHDSVRVALLPRGHRAPCRPPELFDAIERRATRRGAYLDQALPAEVFQRLRAVAEWDDVVLLLSDAPEPKREVHDLVAQADLAQFADPEFRRELGHWIGQGFLGSSWLGAKLSQLAVSLVDLGGPVARHDATGVESAAAVGLLATRREDREGQIRVGQAFERVWLMATHLGLALQPLSRIVERPETRGALARLLGDPGLSPLQPFRLGYAADAPAHPPRRDLADVMAAREP